MKNNKEEKSLAKLIFYGAIIVFISIYLPKLVSFIANYIHYNATDYLGLFGLITSIGSPFIIIGLAAYIYHSIFSKTKNNYSNTVLLTFTILIFLAANFGFKSFISPAIPIFSSLILVTFGGVMGIILAKSPKSKPNNKKETKTDDHYHLTTKKKVLYSTIATIITIIFYLIEFLSKHEIPTLFYLDSIIMNLIFVIITFFYFYLLIKLFDFGKRKLNSTQVIIKKIFYLFACLSPFIITTFLLLIYFIAKGLSV